MRAEIEDGQPRVAEPDFWPIEPGSMIVGPTLVATKADYLISGDKALLALATKYPVLAAAQFWQLHGAA